MKGKKGRENIQEETGNRGVPHLVGNIIGIVIIAVLLPIMSINLTLIIKSYRYPAQVPTVFGVAPLIVMSGSMDPTIQVDDLIFVRKVDAAQLQVRDIIAYQPAGSTTVVTHRITDVFDERGATMFKTKGDWNNVEDLEPVHYNQVVGLYFHRMPGVGRIAMFLQQPVGMVIFVAVPLVLFLLYDLLRRYFFNRKNKGTVSAEQEELERLRALAASLEAGELPPNIPAAPVFVPAPDVAATAYPPIEGEPESEVAEEPEPEGPEPDLEDDDSDEV